MSQPNIESGIYSDQITDVETCASPRLSRRVPPMVHSRPKIAVGTAGPEAGQDIMEQVGPVRQCALAAAIQKGST